MNIQHDQVWPVSAVKWVSNSTSSGEQASRDRGIAGSENTSSGLPAWKRVLDWAIILCLLPAILPLVALLALYIKLVSRGPVLFSQPRVGFRCRLFTLYKFRTMHLGADTGVHKNHLNDLIDGNKPMRKLDDADPRLIPLAKWIRALGLDELAQLLNVLRGEMSLVGPRPCTEYEFTKFNDWRRERFDAVPGLTGLWQVSGKNETTFTEMVRLDIDYARSKSLGLDLSIMLRTFPVLLQQVNPSKPDRRAVVGVATAAGTSTATNTNRNTHIRGYETRTQNRSRRMRILGT